MLWYIKADFKYKGTAFVVILCQSDEYIYALHEKNDTTPYIFMQLL